MKTTHSVAGIIVLMLIQGSWQNPLQDIENKSRLFKAANTEPIDEPRELTEVKRHSQGTFTSDYTKYLDTIRAQDFVQWLMSTKRSGFPNEISETEGMDRRHADGSFTSDINKVLDTIAAKEFLNWLINSKDSQPR
ncbi:glucagon b [Latimeria chalumnae]|uniref:glucagon b n=1 Tax=Latimeria chalumnae TaxID=7897 RepID=UPI00313C29C0